VGYFPSLQGEAKELYERIKTHKDYDDIVRCIELDECIKNMKQEKSEKWVVSYAGAYTDWRDTAKYCGRQRTQKLLERRLVYQTMNLKSTQDSLCELYKEWNDFPDSRDEFEHFIKRNPNATLKEAYWKGFGDA
jgi:hypothetical protein